jgi:hypothetical protein
MITIKTKTEKGRIYPESELPKLMPFGMVFNGSDYLIFESKEEAEQHETVIDTKQNKEVELWRVKGVLTLMNRIDEVDAAIEQLPEPNRTLARFVWSTGNLLNSESDTVKFVQSVLRLTDEEKDSIFDQAAAIKL